MQEIAFNQKTHHRRQDPETSKQAAKAAARFAASHAGRVLSALKEYGPMVARGLAHATGLTQVQVCRRLPDLEEAGLAEPTGRTRTWDAGVVGHMPERVWRARE